MYWLPKTKLGKWSFWITILGVALMYIPYWIAIAFNISMPPISGLLSIGLMVIFGITSIISIIKNKDRAVLLFISSFFGLLGIFLILGEFLFPH